MESIGRRKMIGMGAASLGALGLGGVLGCGEKHPLRGAHDETEHDTPEEVAPPEDLMREHGVLNRLLLIYEESVRRLDGSGPAFPVDALTGAAGIIRHFIEDYHEKLEEDFVFPRFEQAGRLVELVATLRRQHQAGRRLTEDIQRLATPTAIQDADGRNRMVASIQSFVRMYRPHEAREDTVLFPAFRRVVTPKEFKALGDQFEDKEHELFGAAGFEGIVQQVDDLERKLGINDLNQFTPA